MLKNRHTGWLRVLGFVIPYLLFVGIFQGLGAYIAGANIMNTESFHQNSFQMLILQFFKMIGTFLVLWFFMEFIDKECKGFVEIAKFLWLRFSLIGFL